MSDKSRVDYEKLATVWHDGQYFNPATRHRRRLILQLLKNLPIKSILEIGCGQPYLLKEISNIKNIVCMGTDVSKSLITQNKKEFPQFNYEVLDITKQSLPKKFDLVFGTEVLEHVDDYLSALQNMAKISKKYILITVPSSQVFPIDKMIGHFRHYRTKDLIEPLKELGFKTVVCYKWGFPFHNFYKHAINSISPQLMRSTFAESEYTPLKKLFATMLYYLFFLNIKFWGFQLVILAKRIK